MGCDRKEITNTPPNPWGFPLLGIRVKFNDCMNLEVSGMSKLTSEQKELLSNITQELRREVALAYIANGYSNKTKSYLNACKKMKRKPSKNPETSASEILSYPNVIEFINSVKLAVAEEVQIDAAWVLSRAVEFHDKCSQAHAVLDRDGDSILDENGRPIYKFEPAGVGKALELIGKHVSVQAFKETQKVETSGHVVVMNKEEYEETRRKMLEEDDC